MSGDKSVIITVCYAKLIYKNKYIGEKYYYFNANLCKFLQSVGTPSGDKMILKFDIPEWIKNSKEFSREYLKIAFLCEGSKYKQSKNTERKSALILVLISSV